MAPAQVPGPSFQFDLHKSAAIPGLDGVASPKIESAVDAATPPSVESEAIAAAKKEVFAAPMSPTTQQPTTKSNVSAKQQEDGGDAAAAIDVSTSSHKSSSDRSSSNASSAVSSDTEAPVSSPPFLQQQDYQQGSGQPQGAMITISAAELERWQQRVVHHIEDHFSSACGLMCFHRGCLMDVERLMMLMLMCVYVDEQLKRIAEFGRAHANLLVEAKEYVYGIETKLREQFERDRAELRVQADAYVAHVQTENQRLRGTIAELRSELETLRLRETRHGDENAARSSSSSSSGSEDEVEVVAHEPEPKKRRAPSKCKDIDAKDVELPLGGDESASAALSVSSMIVDEVDEVVDEGGTS